MNFIKESIVDGKLIGRKGLAERKSKLMNRVELAYCWEDIQEHVPRKLDNDLYSSKEFFEWLGSFDMRECLQGVKISAFPRLFLYSIFDLLAPISCLLPMKVKNIVREAFHLFFEGGARVRVPKFGF